jgi:hypothetical protein
MPCLSILGKEDKNMLCFMLSCAAAAESERLKRTLAWNKKASRPFIPDLI